MVLIISKFVIISLIVALLYAIGFLVILTDHAENKCDMTYMYEYPQFVKIKVPAEDLFPRYVLYAYSEGKLTERARAKKFDGVPVLFVPGNAGSYKQVRSLASVALRKSLSTRVGYHFDFFTVDLHDELSGLNGVVLEEQRNFLNHSLYRILDLYNRSKSNRPESVIVIGHSMGGVVAHSLLVDKHYFQSIDLLITLASPHRRPSICLDSYIAQLYQEIEQNSLNYDKNTTIITVAGGNNDLLVNSAQTNFNQSSLNVITTAIPTVWLTTDHACITWCKQFVLTVVRALFDSVDLKTLQLSTDHSYRLAVFKHHLLKNSGTNARWAERYKVIARLDDKGQWKEDIRRQYSVDLPRGAKTNQWYMVRIIDNPKHQALFVQTINFGMNDWIFACAADGIRGNSRYCENGIHLSHLSKISPSANQIKRRTLNVDLLKLKKRYPKISHVAIRVIPTQEPISIDIDVYNPDERKISVNLPRWFSLSRTEIIGKTDPGAVRYEIELNGLQHVIQTYLLYVDTIGTCAKDTHHATASFSVPWAHHDLHTYITETTKKPLQLRLYNSKPALKYTNSTAKVYLTLDPSCQYSISVRNSFIGMLGQFAKFYSPMLIPNIAAVILMSFRSQLISLEENGYCSLFQSSLSMSTKPYYLITSAKLLSRLLAMNKFSQFLPVPDTQILLDENLDFLILPLLLYITSVGLTYLMTIGLWASIILSESTVHRIVAKFITRTVGGAVKWSDWLLKALHRVPIVLATTLLLLSFRTCGALVLCLGLAYYFLKLTHLCQDYIEGLAYKYAKTIVFKLIRKVFPNFKKPKTTPTATTPSESSTELVPETRIDNKNQLEIKDNPKDNTAENKLELKLSKGKKTKSKKLNSPTASTSKAKTIEAIQDEPISDCSKDKENDEENEIEQKDNEINHLRSRSLKTVTFKTDSTEEEASTSTSEEEQKEEAQEDVKEEKDFNFLTGHSEMHFHFTVFLMWLLIAALNVPNVLTWARNFHYMNVLRPDPSLVTAVVLCACAGPLWQLELPNINRRFYKELGMFVYGMALLCLIYAPLHLYRLSYILTATIVVTMIHQLIAPNIPEEESTEEATDAILTTEVDPVVKINDIKAKLE